MLHCIVASLVTAYERRTRAIFLVIGTRLLSPRGSLEECVKLFQGSYNAGIENPHAGDQRIGMF